uniref:Evasin n=1 Tax=Rhipicephalus appendiculatus TaxID=34631 RepID=A0A131YSE8_RHIAP
MKISGLRVACFFCVALGIVKTFSEANAAPDTMNEAGSSTDSLKWDSNEEFDLSELGSMDDSNESDNSTELDYSQLNEDVCTIIGLKTEYGPFPVNCTKECLQTGEKSLNDSTPCIAMSNKTLTSMSDYQNVTCTLGICSHGACKESTNHTWCVKYPVINIDPPN